MRSGGKCGYESGDLVTVRDEVGWHDNSGKEKYVSVLAQVQKWSIPNTL